MRSARSLPPAAASISALHLVISTEEQLAGVPDYAKAYGIPSFKLFMYSRGGEGLRIGLPDIDDGFLFRLAEAVVRCAWHSLPAL